MSNDLTTAPSSPSLSTKGGTNLSSGTNQNSTDAIVCTGLDDRKRILLTAAALSVPILVVPRLIRTLRRLPPIIYDRLILSMTSAWYRTVLNRLNKGDAVLDVGIGTAGALLSCRDIIVSKKLRIVGIDYNELYVRAAQDAISREGLEDHVAVVCASVYDSHALSKLTDLIPLSEGREFFDLAYFSGSFSLLPDPAGALHSVSALLPPSSHDDNSSVDKENLKRGTVYVTQTYQRKTPPFLSFVKPLLKYMTTIDFGRLITTEEIVSLYKSSGAEILEHSVIQGSLDNKFQAAYLSVLRVGS